MGATWPEQETRDLQDAATAVGYHVGGLNVLGTLRSLNDVINAAQTIAAEVIAIAATETEIPAAIVFAEAQALGIPPSTLRGLRR